MRPAEGINAEGQSWHGSHSVARGWLIHHQVHAVRPTTQVGIRQSAIVVAGGLCFSSKCLHHLCRPNPKQHVLRTLFYSLLYGETTWEAQN